VLSPIRRTGGWGSTEAALFHLARKDTAAISHRRNSPHQEREFLASLAYGSASCQVLLGRKLSPSLALMRTRHDG